MVSWNLGISQSQNLAWNLAGMPGMDGGSLPDTTGWDEYNTSLNTDPQVFSLDTVLFTRIVAINPNYFLLAYREASSLQVTIGHVATAEGEIVFYGPTTILASAVGGIDIDMLDSNHAILVADVGGVEAWVLTIDLNGTPSVTAGTPVTFSSGTALDPTRVVALSPTSFIIGYEATSTADLILWAGSVSGTTITAGNSLTVTTDNTSRLEMCKISGDMAVIAYRNDTTGSLDASMVNIVSDTPSIRSSVTGIAGSDTTSVQDIAQITDGRVVLTYENTTPNPNEVQSIVLYNNAGTLTKGTANTLFGADPRYIAVCCPNPLQTMVAFDSGASAGITYSGTQDITGSTISSNSAYATLFGDQEYLSCTALSNNFVVLAYVDTTNGGAACLAMRQGSLIPVNNMLAWYTARRCALGAVSVLYDYSGNYNNATQASGTLQPVCTADQQNGLPGIISDGVDDYLTLPVSLQDLPKANNTAFIVAKFGSGTTTGFIVGISSGGGAFRYMFRGTGNLNDINFQSSDGVIPPDTNTGADITAGNLYTLKRNGTGLVVEVNGEQVSSNTKGADAVFVAQSYLFTYIPGVGNIAATLCEAVFYDTALDDTTADEIANTFMDIWGTP